MRVYVWQNGFSFYVPHNEDGTFSTDVVNRGPFRVMAQYPGLYCVERYLEMGMKDLTVKIDVFASTRQTINLGTDRKKTVLTMNPAAQKWRERSHVGFLNEQGLTDYEGAKSGLYHLVATDNNYSYEEAENDANRGTNAWLYPNIEIPADARIIQPTNTAKGILSGRLVLDPRYLPPLSRYRRCQLWIETGETTANRFLLSPSA